MHIDDTLRRPHPVVLFRLRNVPVLTVDNLVLPLDAREIDPPFIPGIGRRRLMCKLTKRLPGKCDFNGPSRITIAAIVESALNMYRGAQPRNLPVISRLAPLLVRLVEK